MDEKKKVTLAFFAVIFFIFFLFFIFRLKTGAIYETINSDPNFFQDAWLYLMSVTMPISLYGLMVGLRGLYQNRGKAWPLGVIFLSLASLFIVTVFSVLIHL